MAYILDIIFFCKVCLETEMCLNVIMDMISSWKDASFIISLVYMRICVI